MTKALLLAFALVLGWLQWECLPRFAGSEDTIIFVPPVIDGSGYTPWMNKVWPGSPWLDPTGAGRYLYHGPLYPVFAWLGGKPASVEEAIEAIALRRALLPIGWICVYLLVAWRWQLPLDRRRGLSAAACLFFSFAVFARESWGRSEDLATLVLMAGIVSALAFPRRFLIGIGAVTVGLVTGINPWNGIIGGLILGGVIAAIWPSPRTALRIVIAAAASIAVFGLAFRLLYPFEFKDWWEATWHMSSGAITLPVSVPHAPNALFNATWVLAAAGILLRDWPRIRARVAWPAGFAVIASLLLFLLSWHAVAKHQTYYGNTPGFLFFLALSFVLPGITARPLHFLGKIALIGSMVGWLGYGVGMTGRLLGARLIGERATESMARFESLVHPGESIAVPGDYFYLCAPAKISQILEVSSVPTDRRIDTDVLIVAQSPNSGPKPPAVEGFVCVWDNFSDPGRKFWLRPEYFPIRRWAYYRRLPRPTL